MIWLIVSMNLLIAKRRRADGMSPVARSKRENYVARSVFMGAGWLFFSYAVAIAAAPGAVARLGVVPTLDLAAVRWLGIAAIVAGLGLTFLAQVQMGSAWRIGVPESAPAGLVTEGLFGVSRNPIYLGLLMMFLGVALCAPTWIMLAAWLGGAIAGDVYVRSEERFLAESFGDAWAAYRRKVRRWL